MRVLMLERPSSAATFGGEHLHLARLVAELGSLGIQLVHDTNPRVALEKPFDIVHLWNLQHPAEALAALPVLEEAGIPMVLTPLYNDLRRSVFAHRAQEALAGEDVGGLARGVNELTAGRLLIDGARCWQELQPLDALVSAQRKLLTMTAGIFPLSRGEAEAIATDVGPLPEVVRIAHVAAEVRADQLVELVDLERLLEKVHGAELHRLEPDLVRAVAAGHRPAAGLADVADIEPRPADPRHLPRQALDEADHRRVAPVAVAAEPHRLPAGTGLGQRHRARETALGVGAVGLSRIGRGQALGAEDVPGGFGPPRHAHEPEPEPNRQKPAEMPRRPHAALRYAPVRAISVIPESPKMPRLVDLPRFACRKVKSPCLKPLSTELHYARPAAAGKGFARENTARGGTVTRGCNPLLMPRP